MQEVYSFEAEFTDIMPVGLTPRGIRIDLPYLGTVVTGPFEGATVQGTDYLLIRADGVGVMDVRTLMITPDDEVISFRASGYGLMPAGVELPPPEVVVSPDFVWPDIEVTLQGFALFETGSETLGWLNRTALAVGGTASLGTRALFATVYAISAIPELISE